MQCSIRLRGWMMNQDDYDLVTMSKRQWREERSRYAKTHRDAAIELRRALKAAREILAVGFYPITLEIVDNALGDTEWLEVE